VLAYGGLYAPFHPVLERRSLPIPRLPSRFDKVRIGLISDLHIQPDFPAAHLAPTVALLQREKPDLILLLGDYVNDQEDNKLYWMKQCAQGLRSLKATLGVYNIFGNHDFPPPPEDPIAEIWEEVGIRPLCDEIAEVVRGTERIYLCGFRSLLSRPVMPFELLRQIPANSVAIALWHEPDRAEECAQAGASLQLSGHTHGGQVVVPFVGPPLLPAGGKRYPSGLFPVDGMPLYVTRGVGVLPPMVRLNCPPEVTLLTLHATG
jgi:hypothetical protein